jgi:hypothetical protein
MFLFLEAPMHTRATVLIALGLASAIGGCSPAPQAAPTPKPATPAPPAKVGTMVCRSSVDGRPVKCGTPNAVMVGVKFD